MRTFFAVLIGLIASSTSFAAQHLPRYSMRAHHSTIKRYYQNNPQTLGLNQRVMRASQLFMGTPYRLNALGEGPRGEFDQAPIFRVDAFDCVTFVSTVLALSESNSYKSFKRNIKNIRYLNGRVNFLHRNHFASVDWDLNNQVQGYIKDVSYTIINTKGRPIAQSASTTINKPNWYKSLTAQQLMLLHKPSKREQRALLREVHQLGAQTHQEQSNMLYLPIKSLFHQGKINYYILKQIPTPSIIEIVRPNWNIKSKIGTRINVSHMGLGLFKNNTIIYREASQQKGKVIDIPLVQYLKQYIHSKTVKGISVWAIRASYS